jgi:hypothetical protein
MQSLEFIEKTISDFSIKRIAILFLLLALGVIATVSYELTTSTFRLDKFLKASELLVELEPLISSKNELVRDSAEEIIEQVQAILLQEQNSNIGLTTEEQRWALVILMSVPWILFSLAGIYEAFAKEPDWAYGVIGCWAIAFLFGWASFYIPTEIHWFYRYIVIPILSYGVLTTFFYSIADNDEGDGT